MPMDWMRATLGGGLIGISVSLMLLLNGRVTGISGILGGALIPKQGDWIWRALFILGLGLGGLTLSQVKPDLFNSSLNLKPWVLIGAGVLVGFGSLMGGGCTSGHGVCGVSRLSVRSIVATVVFISSGVLGLVVFRKLGLVP